MARSTDDTNQSRRRFAHLTRVFSVVLERYKDICNLHPMVASQIDSDAPQNRRLDFSACDYKIDIENATAVSLRGLPDEDKLQQIWLKLLAGDQTADLALTKKVIRACGKVYEQRGLEPARYLRKIKHGRGERVRVAA